MPTIAPFAPGPLTKCLDRPMIVLHNGLAFAGTIGNTQSPLASVVYPSRGVVPALTTETKGLFVVLSQRTHSHGTSEHGQESGHTANRPHGSAQVSRLCSTGTLRGPALTGNET